MPFNYYHPENKPIIQIKPNHEFEQSENPFAPNFKYHRKNYYPKEFYALRPLIIKRYGDRCFICGELANEIHHVDYNTMNNNLTNLCLLCKSCHGKTNFNMTYWKEYLTKKILEHFKNYREEVYE